MSYDGSCADIAALYDDPASLSGAGGPVALGMKQRIPATSTGFTHGYILTSTGALVGSSDFWRDVSYDATIHESFGLAADAGEQFWLMVVNQTGSTIERGQGVKWNAAADNADLFSVAATGADDAADAIGFAQYDIPTGKAAFVLCYGAGVGLANSDVARGDALTLVAGGEVDNSAAITDSTCAKALKTESGGAYPRVTNIFALCSI